MDYQKTAADILENRLTTIDSDLLAVLLVDHSTGYNILWGTNDYASFGDLYDEHCEILPALITGSNGTVIKPRVLKDRASQQNRSRDKAEVFTPAWVCNAQNNLIDAAWFGHPVVFNSERGTKWRTNYKHIKFPKRLGKTWTDYVRANRMEVSCGEAPYLAGRYNVVTGEMIPVKMRIGLLDRKLRIVTENAADRGSWLSWAKIAVQSVYGYDYQGDNVLLARENLLLSVADAYSAAFREPFPQAEYIPFAEILSWNIWQMDGIKLVVPGSCHDTTSSPDLLGKTYTSPCEGCKTGNIHKHNGIYCRIMDWQEQKPVRFIDLRKEEK